MHEALDSKENALWEPTLDIFGKTFADAMQEDFNLFSIVSSILAVHAWGPMLSRDVKLSDLALALFNPTNQHFQHFKTAADNLSDHAEMFVDNDFSAPEHFWSIGWTQRATNDNVETLLNLLFTDKSSKLGSSFFQRVAPGIWLQDSFSVNLEVWFLRHGDDMEHYNFQGTIVEFFAQLAKI